MLIKDVVSRAPADPRLVRTAFVLLHVAVFAALSHYAFGRNADRLFIGMDGDYMLTLATHQFAWTPFALGFYADPFQALGDLWFNLNAWLVPGYLVPHLIDRQASAFAPAFRVSAYVVFSLELWVSMLVMARAIEADWMTATLAAWALPLLVLPYFGTAFVYPILDMTPHAATAMASVLLMLAATARLGRATVRLWRDGILVVAIFLLLAQYTLAYPTTTILAAPVLLFAAAGLILGAASRREMVVKLAGLCVAMAVLTATGFAAFVLGVFSYSSSVFWSSQFESTRQSWYFGSILFQGAMFGRAGPVLFATGVAGITFAAFARDRKWRRLALALLCLIALILLAAAVNDLIDLWSGPSPVYFEIMVWPFYVLFAARLAVSLARVRKSPAEAVPRAVPIEALWLLLVPVAAAMIVAHEHAGSGEADLWPAPGSDRPIAAKLRDEIGLVPGGVYRGRVLTLEALNKVGSADWFDFHGLDGARARATGNDDDTIGLWSNGIPTLIEYNSTISPAFFRAATALLARPGDRQVRSVVVLREAKPRILALFGVRYVIADAFEPPPLRPVETERTGSNEMLTLYEVPNVNLGAYSPTAVAITASFADALARLGAPAFDPTRVALTIGTPDPALRLDALTPATSAAIRMTPGAMVVAATAPGTALLVLPFEFSRCETVRSQSADIAPPRLLRVDALEIGVVFSGRVNAEIRYFTGPFDGATCRLRDAQEFRRLVAGGGER